MSAAQYNITVEKEVDYSRTFQIKRDEIIIDLDGYSFASQIRTHHTDGDSTAFTCTITDSDQGLVRLSLTDTQTAALEGGTQYWDLVMTDDSGIKTRLLEGKCFVKNGITR